MSAIHTISVVPANAGTHSRRKWFGEDSQRLFLCWYVRRTPSIDHAVWVPAFAGTTLERDLYALKYAICVVVASSLPFGDHSSPFWSA